MAAAGGGAGPGETNLPGGPDSRGGTFRLPRQPEGMPMNFQLL